MLKIVLWAGLGVFALFFVVLVWALAQASGAAERELEQLWEDYPYDGAAIPMAPTKAEANTKEAQDTKEVFL